MENNIIQVPRIAKGREFYKDKISDALEDCQNAGYKALFMPEILDTRIYAPRKAGIWQTWYCAPSIRATGRTKQGNPIVVYAHTPNYFSSPKNIRKAIEQGLKNGAGIIPEKEFQMLVDLNEATDEQGNRFVWVVDYDTLIKSESGVIPVDRALAHPQTIPFCGGKERAEKYLLRHNEFYGERIGNWHSDDLGDEPRARVLFVGDSGRGGLDGGSSLAIDGRFAGVPENHTKSEPPGNRGINLV